MNPNLLHPHNNPEILDARPPVSAEVFDESAISGINGQHRRLERRIRQMPGGIENATITVAGENLHDHAENTIHLNGHYFTLANGTNVEMPLDAQVDPDTGVLHGPDAEYIEARNRLAVLESREQNRGSRSGNWAYNLDRHPPDNGPRHRLGRAVARVLRLFREEPPYEDREPDFGYGRNSAKDRYREELANLLSRKIAANNNLDTPELVSEAVGRAMVQEELQMSALQQMAAEQKNSTRILNTLRRHSVGRLVFGVGLGVGAAAFAASGLWVAAAPLIALRTGLGAAGGYLSGRTLWDGIQGRAARRLPLADIRSTRVDNRESHFYGHNDLDYLHPQDEDQRQGAAELFVKMLYAEARAGVHDERRRRLAARLGREVVHGRYQEVLNADFAANGNDTSEASILDRITTLHNGGGNSITDIQERRMASDQTQSRSRHRAGLVGAVIFGAIPLLRGIGAIDLGWGGGGGHHHEVASAKASGHTHQNGSGGSTAKPPEINNSPGVITSGGSSSGNTVNNYYYNGHGNTTVNINLESLAENGHGGSTSSPSILPHPQALHKALDGAPTNVLHVKPGGGFISTFEQQYHLSECQAGRVYTHMYGDLHGAPGTYYFGDHDVRISTPGNLRLTPHASKDLETQLKLLHKMPTDSRSTGTALPKTISTHPRSYTILENGSGNKEEAISITVNPGHTQVVVDGSNVTETTSNWNFAGTQSLLNIDEAIKNHSLSGLSSNARTAMQQYIDRSIESPVHGSAVTQAVDQVRSLWLGAMQHHIENLPKLDTADAENLKDSLGILASTR